MNILVTGGAGFIGSALASRLVASGHQVVVVDNFNDYYDPQLKRDRVATLIPYVPVYFLDILNQDALNALFETYHFDVVCHFAGNAGVRYSIEKPAEQIDANIKMTVHLYETMKKYGVNRMVFASSSSVYGNDSESPFKEDARADRPVSVYGASKRASEIVGHTYHNLFGIETTFLRFFTVYGPWSRPDMAMLKFANLMASGQAIDVYNHGNLKRDFTHINDIVEGFRLAVEKPLGYEIVNLGRGETVDLMTYINLLEDSLGIPAEKHMMPMQAGDVYETFADTTKAKELLGFEAKMPIKEGIESFAHWYKDYYLK